jgi:hypothetical protein
VTSAEEVGSVAAANDARTEVDANIGASEDAIAAVDQAEAPPRDAGSDPWRALARVGAQFIAALTTANDPRAPAHPWIERDPVTGAQNLKMPLPPPETARQIADALSALANSLRGRAA